jgi:hypothetical protein
VDAQVPTGAQPVLDRPCPDARGQQLAPRRDAVSPQLAGMLVT